MKSIKSLLLSTLAAFALFTPPTAPAKDLAKIDANRIKIETIILPDIEFSNTPIRTALDTIKNLGIKSDPEGKGLNLVLKLTNETSAAVITLSMKQPTMAQVLAEIGKQANLKVIPVEYAIALEVEN